jgi:hypothetical protein
MAKHAFVMRIVQEFSVNHEAEKPFLKANI